MSYSVFRVYTGTTAMCDVHRIVTIQDEYTRATEADAVGVAKLYGFPAVRAERVMFALPDYGEGACEREGFGG